MLDFILVFLCLILGGIHGFAIVKNIAGDEGSCIASLMHLIMVVVSFPKMVILFMEGDFFTLVVVLILLLLSAWYFRDVFSYLNLHIHRKNSNVVIAERVAFNENGVYRMLQKKYSIPLVVIYTLAGYFLLTHLLL